MAAAVLRRVTLSGISRLHCLHNKKASTIHAKRNFYICSRSFQKFFTEKHEWVEVDEKDSEDQVGTVGISNYAQDKLGEVVYVQFPDIDQELEQDGEAGCVESVKAASEIYTPVSGKIIETNSLLGDNPKLINEDCYGDGWLFKLKLRDPSEIDTLMNEAAYNKYLQGLE